MHILGTSSSFFLAVMFAEGKADNDHSRARSALQGGCFKISKPIKAVSFFGFQLSLSLTMPR